MALPGFHWLGRWRLVQLVPGRERVALLAIMAAAMGGWFAWWSAPFVVSMINPADNPARLALPADWRVLGFGLALTVGVMLLFGLAPALRASAVKPASALKGGSDPHSRQRLMHTLIAVQVAFCFMVLFVAGLFEATFDRLSHRPTGFLAERLLTLDTVTQQARSCGCLLGAGRWRSACVRRQAWNRSLWVWFPLLGGNSWNGFTSRSMGRPRQSGV